MKPLFWCAAVYASVAPVSAEAGPFGLQEGMPLSRLKVVRKVEEGIYQIAVPQPDRDFETYLAIISATRGLCKVTASGHLFGNDPYGLEARTRFKVFETALTAKYGKPAHRFDFLDAGSVWKYPQDWALGIHEKERVYSVFWETPADPEISIIKLAAEAPTYRGTYLSITYEFKRSDSCIAELHSNKRAGL